jgi:hypothetical protein
VAMATQRALQKAGATVTAAAPMSGPYPLEAFGDAIIFGSVNLGSTVFVPLAVSGYQHAYGNIFTATTDIFSTTYAAGIDTLLPSTTPIATIFSTNLLPQLTLFSDTTPVVDIPNQAALSAQLTTALSKPSDPANPGTPLFDFGFGSPYLVTNAYRAAYAIDAASNPDGAVSTLTAGALPTLTAGAPLAATAPAQPLRLALYTNDLRNGNWAPSSPTLLCGGDQDPTVLFTLNTGTMAAFWRGLPAGLVTVLDVNAAPTPGDAFAAVQTGFVDSQAALLAYYQTAAGGGLSLGAAFLQVVQGYHMAVAPYCALAARSFFSQF